MAKLFKEGESVTVTNGHGGYHAKHLGRTGKLVSYNENGKYSYWYVTMDDNGVKDGFYQDALEQTYSIYQPKGKSSSMNLITAFTNLFVSEPQKSFMKVGVVDSNGNITSDGQKVFMTWLLKQNQDAFNTQVVQPIIAEQEAAK